MREEEYFEPKYARNAFTLASGAVVNLSGSIVRTVLLYLFAFIAARMVGAEGYGLFHIGLTIMMIQVLIGELGLRRALVRYVAIYRGQGEAKKIRGVLYLAVRSVLLASLLLASLLFFVSEWIAVRLNGDPQLIIVLRLFSLVVPFATLVNVCVAFTQGFKIMSGKFWVQDLLQPFVSLVALPVLLWLGWQVLGLVLAYLLSMILSAGWISYLIHYKIFPFGGRSELDSGASHAIFSFSLPLLLLNLVNLLESRASILILGSLMTSHAVGIYSVALQFTGLGTFFLTSFGLIFAPIVADLYSQQQKTQLAYIYKFSTKLIWSCSIPFFLALVLFARPLLAVFGSEFTRGATVLTILSLAHLINVGVGNSGQMIVMSGRPGLSLMNGLVSLTFSVILSVALIPKYGLLGAAAAQGLAIVLVNLLRCIQVYLLMQLHPYRRDQLKPILSGVIAFGVIYSVSTLYPSASTLAINFLYVVAFGSLYFLFLHLLGLEADEVELLSAARREVKRRWENSELLSRLTPEE